MYRSYLLASCAVLAGLAAGCGSLADNTDQHEPLAVLQGELTNPDALATSSSVRVAVIWNCGDFDGGMYRISQEVEVQPVFPSRFRLELTEPPPADCMVNPFAEEVDDPGQPSPDVPGSGGGPADPDSPPSAPTTPQDTSGSVPSDFRIGLGTIAAYDDINGNGKLDLVDPGATEYVDAVLGTNESLMLVYLEGSVPAGWDEMRDSNGNLPTLGYNLLNFSEPMRTTPDSGDVLVWCGDMTGGGTDATGGTGEATDEPVPMPEGPSDDEYEAPTMEWLNAGTFFVLTMTSDPQFASMMCRDSDSFATGGSTGMGAPASGVSVPVPPQYPASNDPGLMCMPDGLSYYYETCVDQGVCRGKMCTGGCWFIPDEANPPADWPCPLP